MAKKEKAKKEKKVGEATPEMRPLVTQDSKKPLKQIYSGFEIEKRQLILTLEEDFTKKKNGLALYDRILREGTPIEQGYIKDIQKVVAILPKLGIQLSPEFKPNTIRLRKYGPKYILTLKDRKETKKREVEFKLDKKTFNELWPETEGARVYKRRLKEKTKGFVFEYDAFTDRLLCIAETEVTKEEELENVPKLGMDITHDKNWTNKTLSK